MQERGRGGHQHKRGERGRGAAVLWLRDVDVEVGARAWRDGGEQVWDRGGLACLPYREVQALQALEALRTG